MSLLAVKSSVIDLPSLAARMVAFMGCGPSWPASRRMWEVSGREESTQITEVLDSGRESSVSAVGMTRTSMKPHSSDLRTSQTCADGFKTNCSRKGAQGGKSTTGSTSHHSRYSDAFITYNTFSSTKAVYIRGDNQTSTITVRLSSDCSMLQVEQVDIPHCAMSSEYGCATKQCKHKNCAANAQEGLISAVISEKPRRRFSEPVLYGSVSDVLNLEQSDFYPVDSTCLL